jgi:hypothetical protein
MHVSPCPHSHPYKHAQPRAPFVIGTDEWPGVAKLIEECGELSEVLGGLVQVLAKLIAFPDQLHPDGTDIIERLHEEIADVSASIDFLVANNRGLDPSKIGKRAAMKLERFRQWHTE